MGYWKTREHRYRFKKWALESAKIYRKFVKVRVIKICHGKYAIQEWVKDY